MDAVRKTYSFLTGKEARDDDLVMIVDESKISVSFFVLKVLRK